MHCTDWQLSGFGRLAQRYYVPLFEASTQSRFPRSQILRQAPAPQLKVPSRARAFTPTYRDLSDHEHINAILVASRPYASGYLELCCHKPVAAFIEKPFVLPGELAQSIALPRRGDY